MVVYLGKNFDRDLFVLFDDTIVFDGRYQKFVDYYYQDKRKDLSKQKKLEVDCEKSIKAKTFKDLSMLTITDDEYLNMFKNILKHLSGSQAFLSVRVVVEKFIRTVLTTDNSNLRLSIHQAIPIVAEILRSNDFNIKTLRGFDKSNLVFDFTKSGEFYDYDFPMSIRPRPWVLNSEKSNAVLGGYISNHLDISELLAFTGGMRVKNIVLDRRLLSVVNALHLQNYLLDISGAIFELDQTILSLKHERDIVNVSMSGKVGKAIMYEYENKLLSLEYKSKAYQKFREKIDFYGIGSLYFNYKLDFRGRVYIGESISPTSDNYIRHKLISGITHEPLVEYDATASILQILATITVSTELSDITNLTSKPPKDPWLEIFDSLNIDKSFVDIALKRYYKYVVKGADKKEFDTKSIENFRDVITRKVVKMSLMTLISGSNPFAIAASFKGTDDFRCTWKHATAVLAVFYYKYPFEFKLLRTIKDLNNQLIEITGEGLLVCNDYIAFNNSYNNVEGFEIDFPDFKGRRHRLTLDIPIEGIDKKKSNQALLANIFHNIDSQCCLEVSEEFLIVHNKPILTIHDAFLINERDEDLLFRTYNISLYKQRTYLINLLEKGVKSIKSDKTSKNIKVLDSVMLSIKELKRRCTIYELRHMDILGCKNSLKKER